MAADEKLYNPGDLSWKRSGRVICYALDKMRDTANFIIIN